MVKYCVYCEQEENIKGLQSAGTVTAGEEEPQEQQNGQFMLHIFVAFGLMLVLIYTNNCMGSMGSRTCIV